MRFALSAVVALCGAAPFAAAAERSNLRRNLRRTVSDECTLVVDKTPKEKVFKCELDPSDMNGKYGHVRSLKATPDQITSLKAMLNSGDIVLGKTALVHGKGAAFDDASIHVPETLSIPKSIHRRDLASLFGAPANAGGNGNSGTGNGNKSYIITFSSKEDAGPAAKCQALSKAHGGAVGHIYTKVLNGCSATLPKAAVDALKGNPNIASIEEDSVVTVSDVPSWGLDRINQQDLPLDGVIEKVDASGVKVYIIDTGVYGDHADFVGVISSSNCHKSMVSSEPDALDDGNGHGTHVASTACGLEYGVAENCEVCAVKVLSSSGSGWSSDVIAGYDHVAQQCSDESLCVFNASLGGGNSEAKTNAVNAAVDAGVVAVVAAGNESTDACTRSPASVPGAITVGSTTETDGISYFSNYGSCVDVYAPGSAITAAWIGGTGASTTISGTSMASPHVAGIAAGVLSANPDFTPFDVDAEIKENMVQQGIDDRTPEAGLATIFFGTGGTRSPTPGPTTAPPTPPPTPCPEMDVEIKIKTDDYPDETAWTLTNQCGTGQGQTFSGGDYTAANTMHSETFCLSNSEWQFTITDEWGDGLCCGYGQGAYEIWVDGAVAHSGSDFGSSETKTIGSCDGGGPAPSPTNPPSAPVTSSPTGQPTNTPTGQPTPIPTNSPTAPVTSEPTRSTPSTGVIAEYDAALGAPRCSTVSSSCSSGIELLDGKTGNNELNPPNTLDACVDGPSGTTYHLDESVDSITVRTIDGGDFQVGKTVEIEARVWSYNGSDRVDFFYSPTATDPIWTLIGTSSTAPDGSTVRAEYALPSDGGEVQAVRVQIRYAYYLDDDSPCSGGIYDDVDDVAFAVLTGGSASAQQQQAKPRPLPPLEPLSSSSCTAIGDRRRCLDASAFCEWRNGQDMGCYAKDD